VPIDPQLYRCDLRRALGDSYWLRVFVPKKGVDIALDCLASLPPRFKLTIVGEGAMKAVLMERARELKIENRVTWTGPKPLRQTLQIIADGAILLHPARVCEDGNAEGTPQAVLSSAV